MTVTAPAPACWDCYWSRMGRHEQWWVADESPGGLGEREVWVDESALDMIARGDAAPVTVLRQEAGMADWIGATVRFREQPGVSTPVVYRIICRRWSQANGGRPYYVLAWPDLPSVARERLMAEPVTEPAEARGGERPDWEAVRPGEPLPENLQPGDRVRLHAEGAFSEGALPVPEAEGGGSR